MEEYQDYKMIITKGSDKLSEQISNELKHGYIPHGSPTISATYLGDKEDGSPKMFILVGQAMVLPFDEDED